MNNGFRLLICLIGLISFAVSAIAHDTTHIHPLISAEIARLIKNTDSGDSYGEIYQSDPDQDPKNPADQLLYWGTDFDAGQTGLLTQDYLLNDRPALNNYVRYDNVIDGVVQEDIPSSKVEDHFFDAVYGIGLNTYFTSGKPSDVHTMPFFIKAIDWYGGYTDAARHAAYFEFGQALHLVEDMSSPAHVHNTNGSEPLNAIEPYPWHIHHS